MFYGLHILRDDDVKEFDFPEAVQLQTDGTY